MTEFMECDSCRGAMNQDTLVVFEIRNIGIARSFGDPDEFHACSPECVEEIGKRISRKQHGLNPIVGRPDKEWGSVLDGSETEERHQVTIWSWDDLRSGAVDPRFDEAAREMAKVLQPGHGDPSSPYQSQGWKEPGRSGGDVPLIARLRRRPWIDTLRRLFR